MQDVWSTLETLKEKDPEKYKVPEHTVEYFRTAYFERSPKNFHVNENVNNLLRNCEVLHNNYHERLMFFNY
jgi:hypothetical protein